MASRLVAGLPELHIDAIRSRAGRKFAEHRQQQLTRMLVTSYEGRNAHRKFPASSSFSRDYLVRTLRTDRSPRSYQKLLAPFFSFPEGNGHYSKKWRETKVYTLHPHVVSAIDKAMLSPLPAPVVVADAVSIPANGIPEPLSKSLFVPSVINLTEDNVLGALEKMQRLITAYGDNAPINPQKPRGITLQHGLRQLLHVNQWRKAIGGIPNTYVEDKAGRLTHKGLSTHIISLPSLLRSLLLEKTDLVSFDMKASFYSLYVSLAVAHGITATHAQNYLENRSQYHAEWSRVTGHANPDTFKSVCVAWLTGSTLSTSSMTRAVQSIGREAMSKLSKDEFARLLYAEVRQGITALIDEHTKDATERGRLVTNALGKELLLERSTDFGKASSHILVGCEQLCMRAICERANDVTALIYDGMLSHAQPVAPLEAQAAEHSRNVLGFALNVKLQATRFAELVPAVVAD